MTSVLGAQAIALGKCICDSSDDAVIGAVLAVQPTVTGWGGYVTHPSCIFRPDE